MLLKARYHSRITGPGYRNIELGPQNTVVGIMHAFNLGHEEGPECYRPGNIADHNVENVMSMHNTIKNEISPLADRLRQSGFQIVHLMASFPSMGKHANYRRLEKLVDELDPLSDDSEPDWSMPPPCGEAQIREFVEDSQGQPPDASIDDYDIAPALRGHDEDWIITSSRQLSVMLNHHDYDNVLLMGFDTYGCIMSSPGGTLSLNRMGYRSLLIEECTASGAEPWKKDAAIRSIELLGWSYTVSRDELLEHLSANTP